METGDDQRRCEKCNSTQTYIRRITNERVCRVCGHITNLNKGFMNLELDE